MSLAVPNAPRSDLPLGTRCSVCNISLAFAVAIGHSAHVSNAREPHEVHGRPSLVRSLTVLSAIGLLCVACSSNERDAKSTTPISAMTSTAPVATSATAIASTTLAATSTSSPDPICPDLHTSDPSTIGLRLETKPFTHSITQASTGTAYLTVTNINDATYHITDVGSPIIGILVDPGTLHVRGQYSGGISGTGFEADIAPGQSVDLHVVFVAAICGGGAGAVPPGTYGLRVAFTQEGPSPSYPVYLADEVPITVTAATVSTVDPAHTLITDFGTIVPP